MQRRSSPAQRMNPQILAARAAVLQRPRDPAAHYALAQLQDRAGDLAGALDSARAALEAAPDFAPAHNLRGLLLAGRGDFDAAIASFRQAIRCNPDFARAFNNLGNGLRAAGRIDEAQAAFAQAVALQPDYALAHHNLGAVRQALGNTGEAAVAFARAVELDPAFRPGWTGLAVAQRDNGRLDAAMTAFRQAIALDPPGSSAERLALAELMTDSGLHDDAAQIYAKELTAHPDSLRAALGFHLALPQVYANGAAIDDARARYAAGLTALERDFDRLHAPLDLAATLEAWRWSNFFLAYQGRDDRALQEQYARLLRRAVDSKAPGWRSSILPRPTRSRIRVGFASAFFTDGTVGQYFGRWVTGLDRARFEIFVYQVGGRADATTARIAAVADRFHHATGPDAEILRLADSIRDDALEVLVYPELGMDTRCMVLAALRLAPVQCAAWGHPVTSGHDPIDYFFTPHGMEPDDGDAHYTERLVRLPGIGTTYPRPTLAGHASNDDDAARAQLRERLGMPTGAPLFLCPQALFKILPDDDALFASVLSAVPGSALLVFEGRHRAVTGQYLRRLATALAGRGIELRQRVRVLARMPRADFLHVNAACDAMLDTVHWSGGNTSLDALAAGLPIVSLPGTMMRARQSAGMLRLVGLPELIAADAADYVQIAARLVQEPDWRAAVSQRLREGSARLFDDREPLAALADFVDAAVRR